MKTTIDIPESLYKKTKIRAVEEGRTLKQIVLRALERELKSAENDSTDQPTISNRRRILPGYSRHQATGSFSPKTGDTDSTELISHQRDAR